MKNRKSANTKLTKLFLILFLILGSVFLFGCTKPYIDGKENAPATQDLKEFKNIDELKAFIQETSASANYGNIYLGRNTLMMTDSLMVGAPKAVAGESTNEGSADDFSQTNIQIEGVDEADFVKNDDKYIYMIANNELIIIDAYDAQNAEIISTTKIKNNKENTADSTNNYDWNSPQAKELFINSNKNELVLFVETNERVYYFEKYNIKPIPTYRQKTYIHIYDVSDKESPELKETFSSTGSYYSSRMIGDVVYIITQESVNMYYPEPIIQNKEGLTIVKPKIFYFDNPETNYQHNTITSIDLQDNNVIDSKTFMLGYSNTLMVSEDNIYIAYQKQQYWPCRWVGCAYTDNSNDDAKKRFYEVVVPLLKGDIKTEVNVIISNLALTEEEKWSKISVAFGKFYEKATNDEELQEEYEEMFGDIDIALQEYDLKKQLEDRKTIIHKISIDSGKINYEKKGEVNGALLNQFSMDEFEGNLRVATTINVWANEQIQYNNVYVLDENMKTIGKIEEIGKDEKIYSTRFIGERLYMVTFQQIDPFFVIDLSNPKNPEVLGKLKIPGYSDYLHPYDENHIIGIGKETETNEYGGTITKGLKIALFDVSDVENPKLVDKYEIGDRGTDSLALHDHKAFLFSSTKNILVLPVTEITEKTKKGMYAYDYKIWHGAYVFDVSKDGFELKGKVKHSSSTSSYYNWWNQASVLRSLYMDNNLYTISNKYVKINDLGNNLEELNSINLPYSENYPRYYY